VFGLAVDKSLQILEKPNRWSMELWQWIVPVPARTLDQAESITRQYGLGKTIKRIAGQT